MRSDNDLAEAWNEVSKLCLDKQILRDELVDTRVNYRFALVISVILNILLLLL